MKIQKQEHIQSLIEGFESIIQDTKTLIDGLSKHQLNTPEAHDKWSMLQCIKHLSLSAIPYIKNVEQTLAKKSPSPHADTFSSSWRGDFFTRIISPGPDGEVRRPVQTFRSMNPIEMLDMDETLAEFVWLHSELIELIKVSSNYDITKIRVPTALGPIVTLRMGDAFRFLLGHAQRHMVQLKRIKATVE